MVKGPYRTITSFFGPRKRVRTKNGRLSSGFHGGIDIYAPKGTPVPAMEDGVVERIVRNPKYGYGNYVVLRHPDNSKTLYAHLSSFGNIFVGMPVEKGTTLGGVGQTGNSTGDHLHFTLYNQNGERINPLNKYSLADFNYFASQQPTNTSPSKPMLTPEATPTRTSSPAQIAKATPPRQDKQTTPQLAKSTPSRQMRLTKSPFFKSSKPTHLMVHQEPYHDLVYTPNLTPNWWQRNMPVIFGGWGKEEWTAYHKQQELDKEVFTGITTRQLMAHGFTDNQIDAMRSLVVKKHQQSLAGNLGKNGTCITTRELQNIGLDREESVAIARMSADFFNRTA